MDGSDLEAEVGGGTPSMTQRTPRERDVEPSKVGGGFGGPPGHPGWMPAVWGTPKILDSPNRAIETSGGGTALGWFFYFTFFSSWEVGVGSLSELVVARTSMILSNPRTNWMNTSSRSQYLK